MISLMCCFLLLINSTRVCSQTMVIHITDNGPTIQSNEYYYLQIERVEEWISGIHTNNYSISSGSLQYASATSVQYSGFTWSVNFSSNVPIDAHDKIFKVVFRMGRGASQQSLVASGVGASDWVNSDMFYSTFDGFITMY